MPLPFLILSRLDSDLPSHLPANLPPQASDAASSKKREAFRAAQERQAQVLAWQQSMGITTMPALPPLPAPAKRGRPRQTDIDQKNAQKRPPMKRTKKAANTLPLPPPQPPVYVSASSSRSSEGKEAHSDTSKENKAAEQKRSLASPQRPASKPLPRSRAKGQNESPIRGRVSGSKNKKRKASVEPPRRARPLGSRARALNANLFLQQAFWEDNRRT